MKNKYRPLKFIENYLDIIEYLDGIKIDSDLEAWKSYHEFFKKKFGVKNLSYECEAELYFHFLRGYILEG